MLNLPTTSYRDMVVKGSDLVVGTYGRGFWILDDISPLRQLTPSVSSEQNHLFKPAIAVRVRRNVNDDTPFPPEVPHADNPPAGVVIYYQLGSAPSGEVSLEIKDERGRVVRHMSSAPIVPRKDPPPPVPDFWLEKPVPLSKSVGLNRTNWNLRFDNPAAFSRSYEINANPGQTPQSPEGPLALPGNYTITLTVDGKSSTQPITVENDPRSPASAADLRAQYDLQMSLYKCTSEAWDNYQRITGLRAAIAAIVKADPPVEVAKAANELDTKLAAIGGSQGFGRRFGGGGPPGSPVRPPQPNFAAINGSAVRRLNSLDTGDMAPSEAMKKSCEAVCSDFKKASTSFEAVQSKELAALNALLVKNNLKPIGDPGSSKTEKPRSR